MKTKKAEELRMKWITGRTNIISDMLDNPGECEIYPTSKCFTELDDLFNDLSEQIAICFASDYIQVEKELIELAFRKWQQK